MIKLVKKCFHNAIRHIFVPYQRECTLDIFDVIHTRIGNYNKSKDNIGLEYQIKGSIEALSVPLDITVSGTFFLSNSCS